MKILIPTDFSTYSDRAIQTCIQFSKKFGASIDVVHYMNDHTSVIKEAYPSDYDPILELVQKNLTKIGRVLDIAGVDFDTMTSDSDLIAGITEQLETGKDYDLIIMGAHGKTGYNQSYIGSNTLKVIRKVATKVLIIKDEPTNLDFKEVVFVTGLDSRDKLAFAHFLEFIKPFNPEKIHILTIDTPAYFAEPSFMMEEVLDDFGKMTKDLTHETHFYDDYSVEAGVRHFTENNTIDLIAISNHVKHPIKRIFRGSNVEAIINQSIAPVLTIDFPK